MDVLNDILDTLDLNGVVYFRTDFSGPWGVTVPEYQQAARFHLLVQGHCHVSFPSGATVKLTAGDLILIPGGISHVIADSAACKAPPLETVLQSAGYDGQGALVIGSGDAGASTRMICGHFNFRKGADHPVLGVLPEYLITSGAMRAQNPWLDDMLRLIARRLFSGETGSDAVVTRLSESVFIELLTIGISQHENLRSFLQAFCDRHIGQALKLIHARPDQSWTVQTLAKEIGMSRSRFAERFSKLIGTSPMAYLGDWRLQKALALLGGSHCSIQQVAQKTGYQSPAAFTRAFTGRLGQTPSEYRQNLL